MTITWRQIINVHICHTNQSLWYQHTEAETKWPPFRRQHFQVHFLEWTLLNFKWTFTEICSLWSNWQLLNVNHKLIYKQDQWQQDNITAIIQLHWDDISKSYYNLLNFQNNTSCHHSDVILGMMASQITSLTIVYSTVYSGTDPRHWPLCGEFTGDRWIPCTNGQ